jgi:hypothetical protein
MDTADANHEPLTPDQLTEKTMYFSVVNPGPTIPNVDAEDGPGNSDLTNVTYELNFNAPGITVEVALWSGGGLPFDSRKVGSLKATVGSGAQVGEYTGTLRVYDAQEGTQATSDQFSFTVVVDQSAIVEPETIDVVDVGASPNPVYPEDEEVAIFVPTDDCGTVQVMIYSMSGMLVRDFGTMNCNAAGNSTDPFNPQPVVSWDLKNDADELVASGMYLVVVKYDDDRDIKRFKIMVIR